VLRTCLLLSLVFARVAAAAPDLIALTDDGRLLRFPPDRPGDARPVAMSGVDGLIGIDLRPSDGRLYGVTSGNDVYVLDVGAGTATLVSTLTVAFEGEQRSGIDFNPQADRLRLVGGSGQNLRVNVDLGATATDGPLAYVAGDPNVGQKPVIAGAAYTNNRPGVATTRLVELDSARDVLVLQDPPNDGGLVTIGPLGVDVQPLAGFDATTDPAGVDHGWMATGGMLYAVDVATGKATSVGQIGATAGLQVIGLTAAALP
jgi:hypothetical protein